MCRELGALRESIASYAGQFDARALTPGQAGAVVRLCAQIEASAASIKGLAAARSAEGGGWERCGYRSASEQLADQAGPGAAKRALESYGLGTRMQRGRRYARTGQVVEVEIAPGTVAARVQGSRPEPYLVSAALDVPSDAQWDSILDAMRAKVGFVARLLDGEVPADLEQVFAAAGVPLFPAAWTDIRTRCSCPDWENPCKHVAAVLYVVADRLDGDPWLVLLMRGRQQGELLEALAGGGSAAFPDSSEVAPWWPFSPGSVPLDYQAAVEPPSSLGSGRPGGVLDSMEPLNVEVGSSTFVELLRPLYDKLDSLQLPST